VSRSTQFIGLSHKADLWLKENAKEDWIGDSCPHCGKKVRKGHILEEIENTLGMFGESVPIYKYLLKDGTWAEEAEQLSPWSAGPMIFTALKVDGKWIKETLWINKELNEIEDGIAPDDDGTSRGWRDS